MEFHRNLKDQDLKVIQVQQMVLIQYTYQMHEPLALLHGSSAS